MYDEPDSLLEPMGEVSFADRDCSKTTIISTKSLTSTGKQSKHKVVHNQEEYFEENLLEPIAEVPFYERQTDHTIVYKIKKTTTPPLVEQQQPTSSLSDSTAKLLDLQRVKPTLDDDDEDDDDDVSIIETTSPSRNETRVISLDSIIRKGLNEQMAMTAKDIDKIVPNAIKGQVDTDDKNDDEIALIEDSSYDDSDGDDDHNVITEDPLLPDTNGTKNAAISNEDKKVVSITTTNDITISNPEKDIKKDENIIEKITLTKENSDVDNDEQATEDRYPLDDSFLLQPMTGIPFGDTNTEEKGNLKKKTSVTDDFDVEENTMNSDLNYSQNSSSNESYSDEIGSSETETTNSSNRKKRRRKSISRRLADGDEEWTQQNSKIFPSVNKRGRPKKYEEKKKKGRVLKIQRYTGPKRKPGRPKRDDGLSCYRNFQPEMNSTEPTPMDELMAMGHSLFSEYRPKKPGRRKKENFDLYNASTDATFSANVTEQTAFSEEATSTIVPMEVVATQHATADSNSQTALLFKRKPGRPKIDKESGGQIVFQNSELTVVNKINKVKTEMQDDRQTSSSTVSQDSFDENAQKNESDAADDYNTRVNQKALPSDIEILPINTTSKSDTNHSYTLPLQTQISYSQDNAAYKKLGNNTYKGLTMVNMNEDNNYDNALLLAPIDEMLEVHHVEDYVPEEMAATPKKKRGRKPKSDHLYSRMSYSSDHTTLAGNTSNEISHTSINEQSSIDETLMRINKLKSNSNTLEISITTQQAPNTEHVPNKSPKKLSPNPTTDHPTIGVKKIEELLEKTSATDSEKATEKMKRIRKPKIKDFPYPEPNSQNTQKNKDPNESVLKNESPLSDSNEGEIRDDPLNTDKIDPLSDAATMPNDPLDISPQQKKKPGRKPQNQLNKSVDSSNVDMDEQSFRNESSHPERFKRLSSISKPTYYEWSESSMDNHDAHLSEEKQQNQQKNRKIHWRTLQKQRQKSHVHWRTKIKLDQEKNLKDGQPVPLNSTVDEAGKSEITLASDQPTENAPIESSENTIENKKSLDNSETASIDELLPGDDMLITKRKRIPKLKYGSYNFNERRDKFSTKPRMILKYKKKYKRKILKKPPVSAEDGVPVTGDDVNSATDTVKKPRKSMNKDTESTKISDKNVENTSIVKTEIQPGEPVRKKRGPKPKCRDGIESTKGDDSAKKKIAKKMKNKMSTSPLPGELGKKILKRKKKSSATDEIKEYRKHVLNLTCGGDEDSASTVTGDLVKPRKRKVDEDASSISSTNIDKILKKKIKRKKRDDAIQQAISDEQSTSQIYLENYNRVLQDRNKVLLEILEQRSAEIRDLKMRVSNLVKKEDTETEKTEEIDGSWSNAELSKAYSLQKLSKPFYRYVQERFALPLPPAADVDKYINNIHMTRGLLTNMLQILEFDSETMGDLDKVTILQISKIETKSIYEYDKSMDNILGPHSSMTVVVAKGLYSPWCQAVYINFDVASFKQSLNLIIEELHKIKYIVVACVCNYTEGEQNIWSELGVSMGCNYFSHPVTTEFIYAFYYIDDLMFNIYKHFVLEGFTLDMGAINATPIQRVIEQNNTKVILNKDILDMTIKTNDVTKALQLFSQQTSSLIRMFLPNDDAATSCAGFIDIMNSFYQLMTSKLSNDVGQIVSLAKQPYGKNLEYQTQILSEVQLNFYRLRCPGETKIADFQRATMMTIESLKMLQHSTKQKYKMDSFATFQITNEYFRTKLDKVKLRNNYDLIVPPLKVFEIIKEIFLQTNYEENQDIVEQTENLFHVGEIDGSQPEKHYVKTLFDWIAEQYKIKHPHSVVSTEDFVRKLQKIEDTFQALQNPHFKIVEGAVSKIFKKLKAHTFGMSLEVIHTFVVQRHLLRIKYFNAVGVLSDKTETSSDQCVSDLKTV